MHEFVSDHRPLLLKHARAYTRRTGEKLSPEDIAREIELVLTQLETAKGVTADKVVSANAYVRSLVKHAAGRAKRRRTLIDQVAAGDDLQAVSEDLRALDADLPDPPAPPSEEAKKADGLLTRLKDKLSASDALVFALLIEDDFSPEEVTRATATPAAEVAAAMARILRAADAVGVVPDPPQADRRGAP